MAQEITLLEKALQASPQNWQVRRSLASFYVNHDRANDAARLMTDAPEIPAAEKDQVFAAQLMAGTDPAAAHRLLDAFLEQNAASGQGHLLKGRLYRAAGDAASAESHFNVAAILDPTIDIAAELATAKEESIAVVEVIEEEAPVLADSADPESAPTVRVEEALPVVSAPVPLSPRPLAPPTSSSEPAKAAPFAPLETPQTDKTSEAILVPSPARLSAPSAAISAPLSAIPLLVAEDDAEDTMEEMGEGEGEFEDGGARALIVGEGEMVHAHEKDSDAKEKVSALTTAILVHVVIGVLLGWMVIAQPRPNPPQITASVAAATNEDSMQNQTVTKMQQRTASAVATATPVVSVEAFSNVAIPQITEMSDSLTMVSMSDGDTGLGMSMSGFGDVSNMGAIPASMRSRCSMSERMKRLRESGGEDRAEKAVRNGLEFLASKQNENGSFGKEYHAAMTGLALLAFLGHCETPESPKFGEGVVGAALYLMEVAKKNDGMMTNGKSGHHTAYEHAIATYALCELFTMTKESGKPVPGLESILKRAVDNIVEGQTKGGGWAYGYAQNPAADDMSLAGWQIQALKAAYNTGKRFSGVEKSLDKAMEYMKNIQDGKGAFKYRPDNPDGKPTLTGAALLGMQIWDEMDSAEYKKGLAYLSKAYANPTPGTNFYAPYYNTQAFFLHGGKEWEDYNQKFQPKLLDAQNPDGSWTKDGAGGHGGEDSLTMNTAWGCLMLEVYYRYLPTTEKVDGLKPR